MIDQGVPYTITTPLGALSINPNGYKGNGYFIPDDLDIDKSADADVSDRGFGDGSVLGRTRLPGLRYGMPILVVDPTDATRESLENILKGYISSMRAANGTITWNAKDGTSRIMREVRALSMPRATDRIGVYKKFEFELACTRPYVEGGTVTTTSSTALDSTGSGLSFPSALPWFFVSSGGGVITCPNPGSTDEFPVFRITGPVSGPSIVRTDTLQTVSLDGLVIAAGDYVDVNMFDRSILLNGITSVRSALRPAVSEFFSIPPGGTVVQLVGTSFSGATLLQSFTRGAYAA